MLFSVLEVKRSKILTKFYILDSFCMAFLAENLIYIINI